MAEDNGKTGSPLKRKTTRRVVLGGSLAAASAAVAYAATGDRLHLLHAEHGVGVGAPAAVAVLPQDTDAIKLESVKINHLLRRAGFGVTQEENERYQAMGLNAVVDELLAYESINDDTAVAAASAVHTANPRGNLNGMQAEWLTRMALTKRPLQEKLTLFWHGLLTSQTSVVRDEAAMLAQNELQRRNAMAGISDVLRGISMDPAMMIYLNLNGSQKQAPNENYARELMELFSLGVGNYSETDIRQAARAFTGWTVPRTNLAPNVFTLGQPVFRPDRFDSGSKTFLGKTGNFRLDDIVDIIIEQPAHAKFLAGKLFAFFVHPNPTDAELQPFIDVYQKSDHKVGALVEAILRSDAMYSPQAYRSKVKSPVEFAVSAVKALGGADAATQAFLPNRVGAIVNMGQSLFEPPNVAGWPGESTWLNSATMFARLNYVNALTNPQPQGRSQVGGQAPSAPVRPATLGTVQQAVDHFLPLALDNNLPAEARQVMLDFGGGADAPVSPEKLRGLAYLVLASPQFHLA